MTNFQICLKEMLHVSGCRMCELSARANVTLLTVSRAIQHERKIRKNTARDMTEAGIALINQRIRKRLDEIEELRRAGTALKTAYMDEYELEKKEAG